MLVTITIPDTEERTVTLVQDLVTVVQKYPGVEMKTVTRPRLRNAGTRSVDAGGKKKGLGRRSPVSVG
jgi:hypothetical protein